MDRQTDTQTDKRDQYTQTRSALCCHSN